MFNSQGSSGCLSTWGEGATVPLVNPLVSRGQLGGLGEEPGRLEREILGQVGEGAWDLGQGLFINW